MWDSSYWKIDLPVEMKLQHHFRQEDSEKPGRNPRFEEKEKSCHQTQVELVNAGTQLAQV